MKNTNHLYKKGYIVNYEEGDQSLERDKIKHINDIEDKLHTIIDGDTLTYLSTKYYGFPNYWYLIADVNEIENPFVLTSGDNLIIPGINKYNL